MTDYIIFAVGVFVMLMVCGGLFYATATEMASHAFHKTDSRKPKVVEKKTDI